MFSRSNLKQMWTTIAGIVILATSLVYIFLVDDTDVWIFGILLIVGISLLFLPNTLLGSLRKLLNANSDKKF